MARSREIKTYLDFEKEITAGRLQSVYFVMALDSYFLSKAGGLLKDKIFGTEAGQESIFIRYADEATADDIIDLCRNFSSLFSISRLVLVRRCEKFGKKFEKVVQYIQNPDPDTTLILAFDKDFVNEKKLDKDFSFYDFSELPNDEYIKWVKSEFNSRGCLIEPAELGAFISEVPQSFELVRNEITKIANYCDEVTESGEKKVTRDILNKFKGYDAERNPEELMSSILNKDGSNALRIVDNMINRGGINEIYLLNIISSYYMDLLSSKSKEFDGSDYRQIYSKFKIWGDRIDFVRKHKNLTNEEDFGQIFEKILETDQKLKTTMMDSRILITSLVEELANI